MEATLGTKLKPYQLRDKLIFWLSITAIILTGIIPSLNHNAVILICLVALTCKKGQWQSYHIWYIAFACWSLLATFIQYNYSNKISSTQFLFVHYWLPLLILPAIHWTPKRQRLILNTLFFALGYMTLVAILQSLFGSDPKNKPFYVGSGPLGLRGITSYERPPNVWGHPGIYGYGISVIFAFLSAYLAQELNQRKLAISSIALSFLHFIIHKNRGGLMATMAMLPLTLCKDWSSKNLLKVYSILAFLSIPALLVICIIMPSFWPRMERSLKFEDGRIAVWRSSIHLISNEPMFGYGGIKNVKRVYKDIPIEIQGPDYIQKGHGTSAHNSVLSITCSYGIIGGILWCISQIALLIYLYRNNIRSGFIVLCAYQIVGLTHHASEHRALTTIVFLLIGLSIAFKQSNDRIQHETENASIDTAKPTS